MNIILALKALDLALNIAPELAKMIDITKRPAMTPAEMDALIKTMDNAVNAYAAKVTASR